MKNWTILTTLSVGILATHLAFADGPTKQQCVDANTQAQTLRTNGKLASAAEQLRICANAACPQIVRDDCTERLDQIIQLQPTIDFSVRDVNGQDLADVAVDVDGKRLTDKLKGSPMPIDTGDHAFTFTAPGHAPLTKHFLIHAGEKDRREAIVLGAATGAATSSSPSTIATAPPAEESSPTNQDSNPGGTQRVIGVVVAGVGVVGVAVGAIFGLKTFSQWSSAQSDCQSTTNCDHSKAVDERSSAMTSSTISTIGFIAGGAFLAGGAVLYFTAPKASSKPTIGFAPTLGGGVIQGTF